MRHVYICYREIMGEFGRSIVVGEKHIPASVVKLCSESFTDNQYTYHYQPEYKKEALAYLKSKGVEIPSDES